MRIILNKDDPPMTSVSALPLNLLPHGHRGRIIKVGAPHVDGANGAEAPLEDMLLKLGFEEGASIEIRHQGPCGGPLAVKVNDRMIALRPVDAAAVLVQPVRLGSTSTSDRTT
jgi:Fe2+ transport system protein FeoA